MPRGGARKGAGRPKGQGKYGEQTKAIRIPISKVKYISEVVNKGLYEVPMYSNKVATGFPSPADDYLEDKIDLNQYLVKHPACLLYTSPSPRDRQKSRMPSSA